MENAGNLYVAGRIVAVGRDCLVRYQGSKVSYPWPPAGDPAGSHSQAGRTMGFLWSGPSFDQMGDLNSWR